MVGVTSARSKYVVERDAINRELNALTPIKEQSETLDKLAQFLANVADAWDTTNQEQRNKLARCLFQEVWIKDKKVIAVRPQPELKPFFDLNHKAIEKNLPLTFGKWRPRGALGSEVQLAYIVELLYPQVNEICISPRKLSLSQRAQVANKRSGNSLRELAKQYGVSYETIRRTIKRPSDF